MSHETLNVGVAYGNDLLDEAPDLITVITPTHNRPYLLHRTLQSLIAQTFSDFKVIVIADSGLYLPPFQELGALAGRSIYIQRDDGRGAGPAVSRNIGLDLVTTPYLMFLDDDDTVEPTHLESVARVLMASQPPILVTDFKVLEEDRNQTPPTRLQTVSVSLAHATAEQILVRNMVPNSCIIYRFDLVKDLRFDTSMSRYEDWNFLLEVLKRSKFQHAPIDTVVIHKSYRDGEANLRRSNSQEDKVLGSTLEIYRRHPPPNQSILEARQSLLASVGYSYQV